MKIIFRISFISLLFLLIMPLTAQTPPTCGTFTLPPVQSLPDGGTYITLAALDIAAGTTITLEATTTPDTDVTALLSVASIGEIAYADNRQFDTPMLILSYHFAEATSGVSGQILWSANAPTNTASVTLQCSDAISVAAPAAETQLDAARFTPAERPANTVRPRNGTAAGVSYTRYNNGIQITGTDANGRLFTLAFVLPEQTAFTATSDTLIAGSLKYGIAIYRLSDGTYQVNMGPDANGQVRVTVFDAVTPTRARNYTFIDA